jgi:hypothetical protein
MSLNRIETVLNNARPLLEQKKFYEYQLKLSTLANRYRVGKKEDMAFEVL